ncbi:MAG: porin family protein [Xanthobacteraceae bacterium]|nr:MAG: porin family protein [Xanthobacteraceae bacterium]
MRSVKSILLAGTASLLSSAVFAADLPMMMPPPMRVPVEFSGWYLRGDIGMSNQKLSDIHNVTMDTATSFQWLDGGGFDSAPIFGVGAGYKFNSWLRADITGEYRGKASFHALDSFDNGGTINTNTYTASKSELLFLANLYADLGTWYNVTPFVGVGVGTSRVTIDHYRDLNLIAGGGGWAPSESKWNFAWALHAGFGYQVTPSTVIELAYRYVDLGSGVTADTLNFDGTNPVIGNGTSFNHITSHDLKLGVRFTLEPPAMFLPPPLVRKG